MLIHLPNGREGYAAVLDYVVRNGVPSAPRGLKTWDAGTVTIVLDSPRNALPLHTGRRVSRRVAAAEAVQLIGGFSRPELLPASFDRFKEDDGRFWGAYGVRIGGQLADVTRKLRSDRDSRQAVITLWNPALDNVEPRKRDHPCTVALGFRIIQDELRMNVVMRSSDAWLGIPYDFFQFTQLQLSLAHLIGVAPGRYTHTTWSLHLYEEHMELVPAVTTGGDTAVYQPEGIDGVKFGSASVEDLQVRALMVAGCYTWSQYTTSERWYVDALAR